MMNLSYRIYYVWKRNLISYKRFIIPTFLVSMGEPLFFLITFGVGLGAYIGLIGGRPYLNFLVPGVLMSSVVMSSTYESLYGTFVRIVHERLYDSLIATPISAEDAVAGDIVWAVFRGLISGTLLIIFAGIFGAFPLSLFKLLLLFLLMIVVGFLFASLAMIVTAFAPNFDFFNYYSELVITPMLFFSGVFFPLEGFPGWVMIIAQFLPLTHAVNLSRAVFSGAYQPGLLLNLFVIIVLEAIAFYLALIFMKRRLIK
jgi:lipooligosaccharide transport system permease protein